LKDMLQRELTEIADFNGANDVEGLRDLVLMAAKMRLRGSSDLA
jgi:hypothetical protein